MKNNKSKKPLRNYIFAGCTYDTIRYIAEADIYFKNRKINLFDKEGLPNTKACMRLLGFDTNSPITLVLREEEDRRTKPSNPDVLVRTADDPKLAQWCNIYAGKLRTDYYPPEVLHKYLKHIAFDEDVMHVKVNAESFNVDSFGENYNG